MNELLKNERLKRGLSIQEVSKLTGIPKEFIEAIEDGTAGKKLDPYYVSKYTQIYVDFFNLRFEGQKPKSEFKIKLTVFDFLVVFVYAFILFYTPKPKFYTTPTHYFVSDVVRTYFLYGSGWVLIKNDGKIFEGFINNNFVILFKDTEKFNYESTVRVSEVE